MSVFLIFQERQLFLWCWEQFASTTPFDRSLSPILLNVTTVAPLVCPDLNLVGYAHVGFYFFKKVELLHFLHGNLPTSVKLPVVNRNRLGGIPVPVEANSLAQGRRPIQIVWHCL